KLADPEGYWQLTPPTIADLIAFYSNKQNNPGGSGLGEHSNGLIVLSSFPADAGNVVGVVPPTVNIEYHESPRQITLYFSESDSFVVPLDDHGRGQADVHSQSQSVPGYACTEASTFSFAFEFKSDTSMSFVVLEKIEFVSAASSGNCSDYLASVRAQLESGTATQPWISCALSGGLKTKKLERLNEIELTFAFTGVRLSTTTTLLPHCGATTALLNTSPVDLTQVTGVVPLGNLNPSGHTFPSPHFYFYLRRT